MSPPRNTPARGTGNAPARRRSVEESKRLLSVRLANSRIRVLLMAIALCGLMFAVGCDDTDPPPSPIAAPTPGPVDLAIATVSAAAGGLTAESEACLRSLYATADMAGSDLARLQSRSGDDPEDTLLVFRFLLCITEDEWLGLRDYQTGEFSLASLRCVDEQIGIERFVEALWGDSSQISPGETVQMLQSCGLESFPVPPPGQSGKGAFNQVSLLWLMHDSALQDLIDCLQETASVQELDAFFSDSSPSQPTGILQCLAQYADILPSGP